MFVADLDDCSRGSSISVPLAQEEALLENLAPRLVSQSHSGSWASSFSRRTKSFFVQTFRKLLRVVGRVVQEPKTCTAPRVAGYRRHVFGRRGAARRDL